MANFLVTGGAGFIGSNLTQALLDEGHSVRVVDNFSTGRRENLSDLAGRTDLLEGDLFHLETARAAVRDMEFVLHHAALPSVPRSVDNPIESNEAGVTATLNLLVASRDAGVKRLVFASSSSIYGNQDETKAKVESMLPAPISPYGVSKLAAESYCRVFWHAYGFEAVALRYFNVFGPRQNPASEYAAVIPRFITALLRGAPPTVYGNGEQTRDFTYIGNVVKGNLLAISAPSERVAGQVFNMAAGGETSLNQLIEILQELTGATVAPSYEPARAGDILHSRSDISKAREQLGYEPPVSLIDGLRDTVEWYRQNHG